MFPILHRQMNFRLLSLVLVSPETSVQQIQEKQVKFRVLYHLSFCRFLLFSDQINSFSILLNCKSLDLIFFISDIFIDFRGGEESLKYLLKRI